MKVRWEDMVNMVLGVWIAASPWVLGYGAEIVMWNAAVVGGLILVLAAIDLDSPGDWEEWANGALGVWLALSPFVLGYVANVPLLASSVVSGLVVAALAAVALYQSGALHRRHADGR